MIRAEYVLVYRPYTGRNVKNGAIYLNKITSLLLAGLVAALLLLFLMG
jgi:hypothetical protein